MMKRTALRATSRLASDVCNPKPPASDGQDHRGAIREGHVIEMGLAKAVHVQKREVCIYLSSSNVRTRDFGAIREGAIREAPPYV
jgi:hypothetical protein